MRASAVVNRHCTRLTPALRSAAHASTSAVRTSSSGMRPLVHWRLSTLSSLSAMLSQLPCLGV